MSSLNKNHRLKNIWLPAIVTWILSAVLNYAISPEGFSIVGSIGFAIIFILIAYVIYRFGVSRYNENIQKLWLTFGVVDAIILAGAIYEFFKN